MSKAGYKWKYMEAIKEFMAIMKWDDELEIDEDGKNISLTTGLTIDVLDGRGIIEISENQDIFDFYIYYSANCPQERRDQVAILMNEFNNRWDLGRFQCLDYEGRGLVRWSHRIDFEGAKPSGVTIQRNFQPGWLAARKYSSVLAAVIFGDKSAVQAIDEFDKNEGRL